MSLPDPAYAGAIYEMVCNTANERFLFHPGWGQEMHDEFRQLIAYASGYGQERTGVLLHADGWVLNHADTVLTDPWQERGKFFELRNRVVALGQKDRFGLPGKVFSGTGPRATELLDRDTVIRKMGYAMMQAVRHHLVADAEELAASPLYATTAADIGRKVVVERPLCLDDEYGDSEFPPSVTLTYTAPPGWEGRENRRAFRQRLAEARRAVEERAWRERVGWSPERMPSVERALVVDPEDRPNRARRPDGDDRRMRATFVPRFAGGTRAQRTHRIAQRREFWVKHDEALTAFRTGDRDAEFPLGTYRMRRMFGANVEAAET